MLHVCYICLYDTIYIDDKIIENHRLKCDACNHPLFGVDWQTKNLGSFMDIYYLTYDKSHVKCLKKLDEPTDKKFWHEYTDEEIEKRNKESKASAFLKELWKKKKGDGYWTEEAFKPENRNQRDMGELPHQHIELYTHCPNCTNQQTYRGITIKCKFTDGVVKEFEVEQESIQHSIRNVDKDG